MAEPSAVPAPIQAMASGRPSTAETMGQERTSRNTPAVTMVAACISAEVGVGPSMASGSHQYSGHCADLAQAAQNRPTAMSDMYTGGLAAASMYTSCRREVLNATRM